MFHESNAPSDRRATSGAPRHILVLGGTAFVGRAVVAEALTSGHRVTLFNRGITNPDLFPEAEKLRGDRASDLSALAHRTWDAVIDVAAYHEDVVRSSVEVLADQVSRYVFVSTLSVCADHSTTDGQREDARVLDVETVAHRSELYGAHKAACERVVLDALGPRATIARAGMIVGPHDPTNRFAYWPRRMRRGRILAPATPRTSCSSSTSATAAGLRMLRRPRHVNIAGSRHARCSLDARATGRRHGVGVDPVEAAARSRRRPLDGRATLDRRPRLGSSERRRHRPGH